MVFPNTRKRRTGKYYKAIRSFMKRSRSMSKGRSKSRYRSRSMSVKRSTYKKRITKFKNMLSKCAEIKGNPKDKESMLTVSIDVNNTIDYVASGKYFLNDPNYHCFNAICWFPFANSLPALS